jgi:hypothetical protein
LLLERLDALAAERAARERELQIQQIEKDLTLKKQRDDAARLRAAAEKELAKQES